MELPQRLKKSVEDTKVHYRQLGKSGLRVSVPIVGCMSFGDPQSVPWAITDDKAIEILKAAYDRGLNTWDTANSYSNGGSEIFVGKALKQLNIPREKVVILTKCHFAVGEDPAPLSFLFPSEVDRSKDYQNQFGLSRTAIFNQVEASLRRLDTTYIDVLQIHRFDPHTPIEETMKALHDLVHLQFCAEKNGWTKFISMQNQYNLLYREEEREMIRFCNETGVGLIPWAPLCRGVLARPPSETSKRNQFEVEMGIDGPGTSKIDSAIIDRVVEISKKRDWPMAHVALAWINKRVTSPIIGFNSLGRIEDTASVTGKVLTDEEEKYLEELYQPRP
ncbi:Aldo-keto reductase dtxS3, partial [Colletotrichum shisoi]